MSVDKELGYLADQLTKMESSMIDPESFGMLRGQVESLRRDVEAQAITLNRHMITTENTLKQIQDTLAEARGGWRVMLMIGGAAGTVGAVVSWVASHIKFGP